MSSSLFHVIYRSRASSPFAELQLGELLTHCRVYNHQHRLSGLLLYQHGVFLQVLEGEQTSLSRLYAKILRDPRHHAIEQLSAGPLPRRLFPDRSMGFATATEPLRHLTGYVNPSTGTYLLPRAHNTPAEVLTLLRDFSTTLPPGTATTISLPA
ncbi:BLUF domain-containing protein [Hymenobacter sp. YC55]|uniref:BLUF domain-containing protein n=1 Tax=Hymenobacter sp. YC55 TaxID=3034019 RepID=UPI0023F73EFC|nr:BLUF domain-containing protein [Hymenobacter sp. YC55]MDF7815404.1 BLUF domain-containing protein [Hymenobacter sp. YC55]